MDLTYGSFESSFFSPHYHNCFSYSFSLVEYITIKNNGGSSSDGNEKKNKTKNSMETEEYLQR